MQIGNKQGGGRDGLPVDPKGQPPVGMLSISSPVSCIVNPCARFTAASAPTFTPFEAFASDRSYVHEAIHLIDMPLFFFRVQEARLEGVFREGIDIVLGEPEGLL